MIAIIFIVIKHAQVHASCYISQSPFEDMINIDIIKLTITRDFKLVELSNRIDLSSNQQGSSKLGGYTI